MRKERIQKHKREIHNIEHELAHPPEIEDLNVIDQDHVSHVVSLIYRSLIQCFLIEKQ